MDEAGEDLRGFGLGSEAVDEVMAAVRVMAGDDLFGLWPANRAAVEAFLACDTQWRIAPRGLAGLRVTGLDYPACKVIAEARGLALGADDWLGLQVMERAAIDAINGARP